VADRRGDEPGSRRLREQPHSADAVRTTAHEREIAEETGLVLGKIGRKLWTRESRFTYRGREHHRFDHVYLARTDCDVPQVALRHTANERAGLIERRWWPAAALSRCTDKLLPAELADLLQTLLDDRFPTTPVVLTT
jgi:8-oxo-dGTP pyrophosphatase MutT (NUDIX family)